MRFTPYHQYKPSGVQWLGVVPTHWNVRRLKYLLAETLKYGANEPAELDDPDLPRYIRITDIDDSDGLREDTFRSLPKEVAAPYTLREGDLLFARSGATAGKTFLYRASWGACAYAGYLIRARLDRVAADPSFVRYFAASTSYWQWLSSTLIQATIQNVSAERYADLCMTLPPLAEQLAISTALNARTATLDSLVAKKRTLIERLKEKHTALISRTVTRGVPPDVATTSDLEPDRKLQPNVLEGLGGVPEHWDMRRIAMLATKITNGFVGPTRDILVDEGTRYLQSLHIKDERIAFGNDYFVTEEWSQEHAKSILREGDVLIVQTGDIGQVAHVPREYQGCNCHALIIVSLHADQMLGRFLSRFLNSSFGFDELKRIQTGALHPHLNCGLVRDVRVPTPPIAEQHAIADYLDRETAKIDALIAKVETAIERLQEYRAALITAAVTGKIDVRAERTTRSANIGAAG